MAGDPIEIALLVAGVLEEQEVRYVVGGSLASSISGEPRSTLDVDLVVALSDEKVAVVVSALAEEFYSDTDSIRRAIREKSSANLIHLPSLIKVDLFIMGGLRSTRSRWIASAIEGRHRSGSLPVRLHAGGHPASEATLVPDRERGVGPAREVRISGAGKQVGQPRLIVG